MGLIIYGDSKVELRKRPENSIDLCFTDPPYGFNTIKSISELLTSWLSDKDGFEHQTSGFMGKDWDVLPSPSMWKEVYRVLKPGASCLVFAGTRTLDLMSLSLRIAGFEIRDAFCWVYSSGMPKSYDIGKGVDQALGAKRKLKKYKYSTNVMGEGLGIKRPWKDKAKLVGYHMVSDNNPVTDEAKKWDGYGTSVKPAWEPIIWATKPLDIVSSEDLKESICSNYIYTTANIDLTLKERLKLYKKYGKVIPPLDHSRLMYRITKKQSIHPDFNTEIILEVESYGDWIECIKLKVTPYKRFRSKNYVFNALKWGVSGLNINRGRIPGCTWIKKKCDTNFSNKNCYGDRKRIPSTMHDEGRFPSNFLHDDSDEVLGFFPSNVDKSEWRQRFFYCAKASSAERNAGLDGFKRFQGGSLNLRNDSHSIKNGMNTSPSENIHPTVKPIDLIEYFLKMFMPPDGGVVLDPFAGSGTTRLAAERVGMDYILIERDKYYCEIAKHRKDIKKIT